jgi:glutamate dehydrogenase (NAD(P)+)
MATGGVANYKGATKCSLEEFYKTKVDVLIPAALEQMIDKQQAEWINCTVVAEGANAPTTPAGERVLNGKGVEVIPAILANAGGVTVSYFEWLQNKSAESWDLDRVDTMLNKHMVKAAQMTRSARQKYKCNLRTAAYIAALERLKNVYEQRGIFP